MQNRVVTPKIAVASAVRGGSLIPASPPRRDKFEQEMLNVERMAVVLRPVLLKRAYCGADVTASLDLHVVAIFQGDVMCGVTQDMDGDGGGVWDSA